MTPRNIVVITSRFCNDGNEQDPIDRMSEQNRATGDPADPESAAPAADVETTADASSAPAERDEGPVRRPLIRATLKHPEGTPPPPRQPPVFTMHQNQPGPQPPRGQNRSGRSFRSGGNTNNSKKSSRERAGQKASSRGNSSGGNKFSDRQDHAGQQRSGNRAPSRRDKGRSR